MQLDAGSLQIKKEELFHNNLTNFKDDTFNYKFTRHKLSFRELSNTSNLIWKINYKSESKLFQNS